jgi:hypothetical protein
MSSVEAPTEEILFLTNIAAMEQHETTVSCFRATLKKVTTDGIVAEMACRDGGEALVMHMQLQAQGVYTWQGATYAVFSALDTAGRPPR